MIEGAFESKKHAIRQTKDGWTVTFVIHPSDMTPAFAACPLGTPFMLGYREIDYDAKDAPETPQPARKKERVPFGQMTPAQQAGMLCADPDFRLYIGVGTDDEAAQYVRRFCGVESRADLSTDIAAKRLWYHMVKGYRAWRTEHQYADNLEREQ